jgi:hypothetical protein
MAEKPFLTNPLGKWCHLEPKWKKLLPQFFRIFNTSKMQKKFRKKKSLEQKLQLIENKWPF